MAKKVQTRGCASIVFVFVLLCRAFKGGSAEVLVSLEMPRFAARGSSVALHCAHNVQPDLLYKVEWRRAGGKLVQYVRGRNPPFRSYPTQGARLNLSQANEHSIILHNLEFSASGSYSCEVSLETPIYTKSSIDRDLLVIQPQVENPRINFGASVYTAEDTLEASCTTSHAHPAPHITWLINGEKVDVSLVRSDTRPVMHKRHNLMALRSAKIIPKYPTISPSTAFPGPATTEHPTTVRIFCSSKDIHGPSQIQKSAKKPQQVDESLTIPSTSTNRRMGEESLSRSTTKLRVAVSALRLAAGGPLALTCLSTIPAYRGPAGRYADSRNYTVMVDVRTAVEIDPSTTTDISLTNSVKIPTSNFLVSIAVIFFFHCLIGKYIK